MFNNKFKLYTFSTHFLILEKGMCWPLRFFWFVPFFPSFFLCLCVVVFLLICFFVLWECVCFFLLVFFVLLCGRGHNDHQVVWRIFIEQSLLSSHHCWELSYRRIPIKFRPQEFELHFFKICLNNCPFWSIGFEIQIGNIFIRVYQ